MIHFNSDTYQVAYAGERVQLLPKEFALFRFLYEHAGRSFTREALLDAVWSMEAPTDRTVDDHIYRIRRKLAGWNHLLGVETVRGQGYKLVRRAPEAKDNPLSFDEQFAVDVKRLFSKYHSLGMGAAMQLLAENREVLSLPGDPYNDAYLRFIRGDFKWLLTTDCVSLWQKLTYAVYIHSIIQPEPAASLPYFVKLLAKAETLEWRYDLQLSLALLYTEAGKPDDARNVIEAIRQEIEGLDSPSFTALFLLKETYLAISTGKLETADAKLREYDELLVRHPIKRERGAYLVATALLLYRQGDIPSARIALDEGMDTLRHTEFLPHLLFSLNTMLRFLSIHECDETYRLAYQRQRDQLAVRYGFEGLLPLTEQLLRIHL
ncbi:winged helix-turn-helix domain-containing protein [Paenibacillus glycanilyticus]|uniref:winged helix-turn-helix domain-containing protein n=1 Tax=Paenibacillus glycanilyticus TaxID=126569 RepID=UPI00203BBC98|nr:winged helix-turn-helix domain-containing protein [Paenibacillus glycanilyticus]MCM3626721.1 winged helix-turn-helix domain-containing protein [Paenibacillus glycanilyticus]